MLLDDSAIMLLDESAIQMFSFES